MNPRNCSPSPSAHYSVCANHKANPTHSSLKAMETTPSPHTRLDPDTVERVARKSRRANRSSEWTQRKAQRRIGRK